MIRRVVLLSSFAVMFLLANARAADASLSTFLDYIFEMSGPGTFVGAGVAVEFMCVGELPPINVVTGEPVPGAPAPTQAVHFLPKCAFLDPARPQLHVALKASFLRTDGNPYEYNALLRPLSERVYATPVLLVVDGTIPGLNPLRYPRLFRGINVGIGAGAIRLSGQRFEPFWKYSLELPRITLKPGRLFGPADAGGRIGSFNKRDFVQIQVITKIIGSVTPQEFGGVPGAKSGTHIGQYVLVSLNF